MPMVSYPSKPKTKLTRKQDACLSKGSFIFSNYVCNELAIKIMITHD